MRLPVLLATELEVRPPAWTEPESDGSVQPCANINSTTFKLRGHGEGTDRMDLRGVTAQSNRSTSDIRPDVASNDADHPAKVGTGGSLKLPVRSHPWSEEHAD